MTRETSAITLRRKLGKLLNEVQYRKDRIVITRGGKRVAALIDIALFDRLRKLDEGFEELSGGLAGAFSGIEPAKGSSLVEDAVKALRRKPSQK